MKRRDFPPFFYRNIIKMIDNEIIVCYTIKNYVKLGGFYEKLCYFKRKKR